MSGGAGKSRGWVFTVNNWTPEQFTRLSGLLDNTGGIVKYIIFAKEVGESGTPHLQGYVHFMNARRFTSVRRLLTEAHVEIRRGTVEEAIVYCKKDGDWVEFGISPIGQAEKGDLERKRWADLLQFAKDGDWESIEADYPREYILYYEKLWSCYQRALPLPTKLDGQLTDYNTWIWGPPGTGKSIWPREKYESFYPKALNKWWDAYRGEDCVIIDDLEADNMNMKHHLKIWSDRYAFIAQVKGSSMKIRPKHVVVTSNYSMETVFGEDPVLLAAIRRRFHCIHMTDPFNVL